MAFVRLRRHASRWAVRRERRRWLRAARRAGVDCRIAPTARLGRAHLEFSGPGALEIGEGSVIEDGVLLRLLGGSMTLGPGCVLRRGAVLNVSGTLRIEGDVLVSWGAVLHCAGHVDIGHFVTISEYATVVDANHVFDDPTKWHYHQNKVGRVSIGNNTWLCSKSTVTKDVVVGSFVIVAAGSTVIHSLPDGVLASGVPARIVEGYRTT